jgi:hypothetical protein
MWEMLRTNLSEAIKHYEINTRELTFSKVSSYVYHFDLIYYNSFCEAYKKLKSNAVCSDSILNSGMDVVIQYLINYSKEVMLQISKFQSRQTTRTSILQSKDIYNAGTHIDNFRNHQKLTIGWQRTTPQFIDAGYARLLGYIQRHKSDDSNLQHRSGAAVRVHHGLSVYQANRLRIPAHAHDTAILL